jgi:hypothetical protein
VHSTVDLRSAITVGSCRCCCCSLPPPHRRRSRRRRSCRRRSCLHRNRTTSERQSATGSTSTFITRPFPWQGISLVHDMKQMYSNLDVRNINLAK